MRPASDHEIAVLPLGATEQHGPHLPLDTDTVIAEAVAREAVSLVPHLQIRLLPVEPVGYSVEHQDFTGTRSLSFDEAVNRWIGIAEKQHNIGIRRFVILNAHGGNSPLTTIVATELRVRFGMLAVATGWTRFGWPGGFTDDDEKALGIHGGMAETSLMLHLRADSVKMERASNFASAQAEFIKSYRYLRAYGPHAFGWKMQDLNPAGAVGDAAASSAEKGRLLMDHAAHGFAGLLKDVAAFDLSLLDRSDGV